MKVNNSSDSPFLFLWLLFSPLDSYQSPLESFLVNKQELCSCSFTKMHYVYPWGLKAHYGGKTRVCAEIKLKAKKSNWLHPQKSMQLQPCSTNLNLCRIPTPPGVIHAKQSRHTKCIEKVTFSMMIDVYCIYSSWNIYTDSFLHCALFTFRFISLNCMFHRLHIQTKRQVKNITRY